MKNAAGEWESLGEMDSEDNQPATAVASAAGIGIGIGMMEVDVDGADGDPIDVLADLDKQAGALGGLPVDADFFNSFDDDFDDSDLS